MKLFLRASEQIIKPSGKSSSLKGIFCDEMSFLKIFLKFQITLR